MAPSVRRYVLVIRHAQRQDEVEDGWPAAEAARPGGRPWDPPLSSPLGLAQAEEAAAKLSNWERRTGARIIAVMTSPFLRCLQTAAAACRRLGLQQLHVSWSVSETLCRMSSVPSGPLPEWMWTQPGALPGSGGDRGLRPEEYLAQLGAVVAGGGATAQQQNGQHGQQHQLHQQQAVGLGVQKQEEGASTVAGQVLKGLSVAMLPPPADPRVAAASLEPSAARAPAAAADGGVIRASAACAATEHAADDGDSRDGGMWSATEGSRASGSELGDENQLALGTPLPSGDDAATPADGTAAPADDADVAGHEHYARQQQEHQRQQEGQQQWQGQQQQQEEPLGSDELMPPGANSASHPVRPSIGGGGGGGDGATAAAAPSCGVPCTPETLEDAHARYRAALRCLMAAAEAADAGAARGSPADSNAGDCGGGGSGAAANGGGHEHPSVAGGGLKPGLAAAAPWRALWLAAERRSDAPASAAATVPCETALTLLPGAAEPVSGESHEANEATPPRTANDTHASASKYDMYDDEDEEGLRQLLRQPISQVDAPNHHVANHHALGPNHRGHGRQEDEPLGEAVLVVTHGEAVACAAMTAAPWALVYEVRHTGFVVLAAGEVEDEERLAEGGPAGDGGAGAGWELLPDPTGERGVLWMSALDD